MNTQGGAKQSNIWGDQVFSKFLSHGVIDLLGGHINGPSSGQHFSCCSSSNLKVSVLDL